MPCTFVYEGCKQFKRISGSVQDFWTWREVLVTIHWKGRLKLDTFSKIRENSCHRSRNPIKCFVSFSADLCLPPHTVASWSYNIMHFYIVAGPDQVMLKIKAYTSFCWCLFMAFLLKDRQNILSRAIVIIVRMIEVLKSSVISVSLQSGCGRGQCGYLGSCGCWDELAFLSQLKQLRNFPFSSNNFAVACQMDKNPVLTNQELLMKFGYLLYPNSWELRLSQVELYL